MKYIRTEHFGVICLLLMTPLIIFAAPHEPSPAGGGWLELNPKLPLLQTKAPWFPDYLGPLTIEAWVYIDKPPSIQDVISLNAGSHVTFSIISQTDRFICAIVGDGYQARPAIFTSGVEGGSGKI